MSATLFSDPTPVPAGSWLIVTLTESIAGMLSIVEPISSMVSAWIGYAPTTWAIGQEVDSFTFLSGSSANVAIRVPTNTTIGQVATLANDVSNQLNCTAVTLYGFNQPTGTDTAATPPTTDCSSASTWLQNPGACLWQSLKVPLIIAALLIVGYLLYDAGAFGKAGKAIEAAVKPARKPRTKRVAAQA